MRPKRKADDKITAPGKVKRAKAVGDILEHFSEHSSQVKAELVSKIIDREGANFGQNVFQNSKVLKEMNQLDREDTVGLMTGTRSSEYLWRKSRTVFFTKRCTILHSLVKRLLIFDLLSLYPMLGQG